MAKYKKSQQRKRQAQITLLTLVTSFLFFQLCAGIWIENRWPQVRFSFLHRRVEQSKPIPNVPLILCLGSSRTGVALNETSMKQALSSLKGLENVHVANLGTPIGDLSTSLYGLEQSLKQGMRPDLILLELTPEICNANSYRWEARIKQLLRWDEVDDHPHLWVNVALWKEKLLPLYFHRKGIWNQCGEEFSRRLGIGRKPNDKPVDWNQILVSASDPKGRAVAEEQIKEHIVKMIDRYEIGGEPVACLTTLLTRCARENIEVMIFSPPVHTEARKLYPMEVEIAFRQFLDSLHQKHKLTIFDCRDDLEDSYFADFTHLSEVGARLFSQSFLTESITPNWNKIVQANYAR